MSSRATFAFHFYRVVGVLGLIPFFVFTGDALFTPTIPHALYGGSGSVLLRLGQALLFAPLTVALGWLCVRRQPGNGIGWMLVVLGYCLSIDSLRADFGGPFVTGTEGSISLPPNR